MPTNEFSQKLDEVIYNLDLIHFDLKTHLLDKELRADSACVQKIIVLNRKIEELFIFIHRLERSIN